jgi:trimethylamine--corrinoid protein Co-methyltransferase
MHEHTYAGMCTQSQTNVFDRRSREEWYEATSGKGVAEIATERAMEIIENHQPYPLPAGAEEIMDEMVAEFENRLRIEHDE